MACVLGVAHGRAIAGRPNKQWCFAPKKRQAEAQQISKTAANAQCHWRCQIAGATQHCALGSQRTPAPGAPPWPINAPQTSSNPQNLIRCHALCDGLACMSGNSDPTTPCALRGHAAMRDCDPPKSLVLPTIPSGRQTSCTVLATCHVCCRTTTPNHAHTERPTTKEQTADDTHCLPKPRCITMWIVARCIATQTMDPNANNARCTCKRPTNKAHWQGAMRSRHRRCHCRLDKEATHAHASGRRPPMPAHARLPHTHHRGLLSNGTERALDHAMHCSGDMPCHAMQRLRTMPAQGAPRRKKSKLPTTPNAPPTRHGSRC